MFDPFYRRGHLGQFQLAVALDSVPREPSEPCSLPFLRSSCWANRTNLDRLRWPDGLVPCGRCLVPAFLPQMDLNPQKLAMAIPAPLCMQINLHLCWVNLHTHSDWLWA
ncbi:unnamed protein product [Pipistrellus nathusii]|uniref:Uncharacterized protein n=1 Tax=Pipistrellus nathusii TaxID=59473 RepID=A0ABN9ZUS0_PIPNA